MTRDTIEPAFAADRKDHAPAETRRYNSQPSTMVTIEKYTKGIASDLFDVFYTSIRLVCRKDYSAEQVAAWVPKSFETGVFEEKMESIKPFVARIGSDIVGYADMQPCGLIDHFYVHGHHQKKGVGTALIDTILKKGAKLPKLYSHVSFTAKPFYESHGFKVLKVQEFEAKGVVLKNNYMERLQS